MSKLGEKYCEVCGREIQWRKRWERDWDAVKYCSRACRNTGMTEIDLKLEEAILALLREKKGGATICPSEVARTVETAESWRKLMEPTRRAARRLANKGQIDIIQQGQIVDPSRAKGPIRLRLARF